MADRKLRYSFRLERGDFESLRTIHGEEKVRAQLEEREPVAESAVARKIFRRGLKAIEEERDLAQWIRFFQPVRPGSGMEPDIIVIFTDPPDFPLEDLVNVATIARLIRPLPWPENMPVISRDLQLRMSRPLRRILVTDNGAEFLVEFFGHKKRGTPY